MSTSPDSAPPERSGRAQVFQAAGIVSAAFVVSRLVGFGRETVIGIYYGASSPEVNAFTIANVIPETIFYIIAGGALSSAFIPTFAAFFARDDEPGGWRLFSTVLNLLLLLLLLVCSLAIVVTPQLIRFFYPDLVADEPAVLALATPLLRVMLLSTIIFGASGVVMGALQARQHFLLPALAPIIYNLGIIGGTVLLAPNIMGAAVGAVAGAAGHLAIQLPGLRRKRAVYRLSFDLRTPGVGQVLRLMPPRLLGLAFGRINFIVTQFLGQMMVLGSIRALELSWRLMFMPISVIGQALGIASFPTLSTLAARGDYPQLRRILAETLRLAFFLGLPATVLLIIEARPLVATLLQYGAFDAADTDLVVTALAFYAVGLGGLAAIEVLARAFFAMEDTWTPTIAGGVQLGLMVALATLFSRVLFPIWGLAPLGGIALGASLANWLETGALLWLLRRRMGGIDGRFLLDGVARMLLASLAMAGAALATDRLLGDALPLWQLLLGSAAGGLAYLAAAWLLRIGELAQAVTQAQRLAVRLRRRR